VHHCRVKQSDRFWHLRKREQGSVPERQTRAQAKIESLLKDATLRLSEIEADLEGGQWSAFRETDLLDLLQRR
jgi:nicotinamidase-related amidase